MISVEEGDEVLEGTEVAVIVAMKMNNSLKVIPIVLRLFVWNSCFQFYLFSNPFV